jgi:hypothetical protein
MPVRALAASPTDPPGAAVKVETAPLPPPPDPSVQRTTVALVAAGVAVVGAGVGTVFGLLALHNKSDYRRAPTYANSDQGNNDAAYADGALALAVAAAVTSLVLYVTNGPSADQDPDPATAKKRSAAFSASPFVTSHGGGAGALLRF